MEGALHTITCIWSPHAPQRVEVRGTSGPPLSVPATRLGRVLGPTFLARLRQRGTLTLPVFDDEWLALAHGPP